MFLFFVHRVQAVKTDKINSEDGGIAFEGTECSNVEAVGFCDLPVEIIPPLMNSLGLCNVFRLCSVDFNHMLCLSLVLHGRISDGTLNPKQLCDCLRVFTSYLRCAHFVDKASAFYAIQAAQQNITHLNYEIREAALDLFRALFQHNRGFAEAIAVAKQNINHVNLWVRAVALDLFRALFVHGRGFTEAIAVAQQNINNGDRWIRKAALDLFRALVENIPYCPEEQFKNQIMDLAAQAVQQNISHDYLWIRVAAFQLFRALIENIQHCLDEHRAQIIIQAAQAAQQNITHEDLMVRAVALNLFSALVKNIRYCPAKELKAQIMAQASRAVTQNYSSDWIVLMAVQRLKEALNRYAQ